MLKSGCLVGYEYATNPIPPNLIPSSGNRRRSVPDGQRVRDHLRWLQRRLPGWRCAYSRRSCAVANPDDIYALARAVAWDEHIDADSTFAVPGYAVGEIPPVPLFALPNLSLLSASTGAFTPDVTSSLTSVPGITVSPARCDEPGVLASGSTSTVVTGDGGVVTSDGDSSVVNDGNGAGMVTQGSVSIVNDGNGAGTYTDTATGVSIINSGNGAGSYTDAHLSVTVDGTGGGSYTNSQTGESITITGDGSGTYTAGTVSIVNDGNGAGTYTDTATGLTAPDRP